VTNIQEFQLETDSGNFVVRISLFNEKVVGEADIYGIEAEKLDVSGMVLEKEMLPAITDDNVLARHIFDVVTKNKVTPCALADIVDEIVSEVSY
jgi:hypothetical protein